MAEMGRNWNGDAKIMKKYCIRKWKNTAAKQLTYQCDKKLKFLNIAEKSDQIYLKHSLKQVEKKE